MGDRVRLSKIGTVEIRLSRKIEGKIKTLTVKREVDGWYVIFTCETLKNPLPKTGKSVGIDLGIEKFATLSDGNEIPNPKLLRQSERQIAKAQRKVSRKKKGSISRRKAVVLLRKKHLKIKRQRLDFLHKVSLNLVRKYDFMAFENLQIRNLIRNNHLAKSISDASWGNFLLILTAKAENAGREIMKVNPQNTSQNCSNCGKKNSKSLKVRKHRCESCGIVLDRDLNASVNILMRAVGQTVKDLT